MTRVGTRLLAGLALALLAAALLSACGSSSGSDESTAGGAQLETTAKSKESDAEGKGPSKPSGSGQKQNSAGSGKSEGGSSSKHVVAPLKVSGGGSAQFRSKGGDNSVQNYGEESSESELQEVAEIVHRFYVARAEEDWAKACSYLAKTNIEQLEQLAQQAPKLKGKGCPPILNALTRSLPASVEREITYIDAGSFRHDSELGFLVYTGPDGTVYSMPMRFEGGEWRVGALAGTALPGAS